MSAGRELDRLVGERLFGFCWHEFVDDSEACLAEDRREFEQEYGQPPPEGWRTSMWDDEVCQRCVKCGKRWRTYTEGALCPRADQDIRRFSTDIADAWKIVGKIEAAWTIEGQKDGDWTVLIGWYDQTGEHRKAFVTGENAQIAICRAALATLVR